MSRNLLLFVAAQVALLVLGLVACHPGSLWHHCVFFGILSGQFALIGLWLTVADRPLNQRVSFTILFFVTLLFAASTITNFNGWDLLLSSVRFIAVGSVYWVIQKRSNIVVARSANSTEINLLQINIKHMLALTAACSALFALMQVLRTYGGPLYEILLVLLTILVGLGGATTSLVTSLTWLSKVNFATIVLAIVAVIAIATVMAAIGYMSTGSFLTASQWFILPIVEMLVVTFSLVAIRVSGYQMRQHQTDAQLAT